jgi:hypothetical protein
VLACQDEDSAEERGDAEEEVDQAVRIYPREPNQSGT